jgi:hypothetical protein
MILEVKEKQEEPLKDVLRTRPMSKLSRERFSAENAMEIKGELILFNDEFFRKNFPIRKEDMKKLTVFTYRAEDEKEPKSDNKNAVLELLRLPEHGRNLFFNIRFCDDRGSVYQYVDIKGIGLPKHVDLLGIMGNILVFDSTTLTDSETIRKGIRGMWGLVDYESAVKDWEQSNELIRGGVETATPIAIIKINEIFSKNDQRKSIKELKEEGIIPTKITYDEKEYDYTPVVYLRAFSEVMRVKDATKEDFEKFAKEHGMTFDEYVDWWTGKVAKNLAGMHILGKIHGNLIPQNLTIDGRIVDFDTVEKYYADNAVESGKINHLLADIDRARLAVEHLSSNYCNFIWYIKEKRTLFYEKYFENFTNITKENFEALCYLLKSNPPQWEISDKTRMLFEKRFGEKLKIES